MRVTRDVSWAHPLPSSYAATHKPKATRAAPTAQVKEAPKPAVTIPSLPAGAAKVERDRKPLAKAALGVLNVATSATFIALLPALIVPGLIYAAATKRSTMFGISCVWEALLRSVIAPLFLPMRALVRTTEDCGGTYYLSEQADGTKVITLRYALIGCEEDLANAVGSEQTVERILSVQGKYRIDLQFVPPGTEGANDVTIDRKTWPNRDTWNFYVGDTPGFDYLDIITIAHETMHQLGLRDRYDLGSHLSNHELSFLSRCLIMYWRPFNRQFEDTTPMLINCKQFSATAAELDAALALRSRPTKRRQARAAR